MVKSKRDAPFSFGDFALTFKKSLFLRTFSVRKHQFSLPIYVPTEISGIFWANGKQPKIAVQNSSLVSSNVNQLAGRNSVSTHLAAGETVIPPYWLEEI